MLRYIFKGWDIGNRPYFPGRTGLNFSNGLQAIFSSDGPVAGSPRPGSYVGNRIFSYLAFGSSFFKFQSPFTYAHKCRIFGKLRDDFLSPAICPAPIPYDQPERLLG